MRRSALDAFMAAKSEIDSLVAQLAAQSDEHFCLSPEDVDWGAVTSLTDIRMHLQLALDACPKGMPS